jgi:hypothetical protein
LVLMSEPIRDRLRQLVDAVPSPQREVSPANPGWDARLWDDSIALVIEIDPAQGLFVLVAAIGDDGRPHPGPYVDRSGRVVRRHVTELLPESHPNLFARFRDVVGSWPYPDLGSGDWPALTSLCVDLWDVIHELDPFEELPR